MFLFHLFEHSFSSLCVLYVQIKLQIPGLNMFGYFLCKGNQHIYIQYCANDLGTSEDVCVDYVTFKKAAQANISF